MRKRKNSRKLAKFGRDILVLSLFAAAFFVLTFSNVPTASAALENLNSSKNMGDTFVYKYAPNTNYGTSTNMMIDSWNTWPSHGFIRFDLSGIPVGSTISSATIYCYTYSTYGASTTVTAWRTSDTWGENTLTWNNMPGTVGSVQDNKTISAVGWTSFSVTAAVQDGKAENNMISLVFIADGTAGETYVNFRTKENATHFPYLEVNYTTLGFYIISTTVSENLIDRKLDYAGSSAKLSTKITVRFYDNENTTAARIGVQDNKDVLRENQNVLASLVTIGEIGENVYEVSYTYTPDNLPDNGLGPFDIWVYLADGVNTTISVWENSKFTVSDITSTMTFSPVNPFSGWNVHASGVISMYGLVGHSISGIQLKDMKYGTWWDAGTSSSWSKDYKVLGVAYENVTVYLRANTGALDGLITSSYVVNENWQFQINLYWEENFSLVPAAVWDDSGAFPDNYENIVDRNWWAEFWFENYETQEAQLVSTSSLVTTSYKPYAVRVRDRDENYYRTYRTNKENIDAYMVTDANLSLVTMYLITLDDPSTLWGPLNDGSISLYKFVGDEMAYIDDSYWMATNDVSVFLIRGDVYIARLEATGKSPFDYGRIDADYNTSKMLSPGFGSAEYGETIHNIFYMVTVRYWTTGDNHIMIFYQDNYDNTLWVRFTVRSLSGDVLFGPVYIEGESEYTAEWTDPDMDNMYDIEVRFEHGMYGAVGRSFIYLPMYGDVVPEPPHGSGGGLDILGKPPVPWGHLLVFGVLMVVLVAFGPGHSGIGILATAMVAALLNLTGLVSVGWELVFFIVVIGILTQIFESRRGGG